MKAFEMETAIDKLKELMSQYLEYKSKPLSSSKANSICSNAWHLSDWVFKDYKDNHQFDQIGLFRLMLFEKCPYLRIMHDLANAHKHGEVSRPKAFIKEVRKQGSVFSAVFSKEFDSTSFVIELNNGSSFKFLEVIDSVVDFWIYYFKKELNTPRHLMILSSNNLT